MASQSITMKALHENMSQLGKNEVVLDVREKDEYASGHVPGSLNISYTQVAAYAEKLKKYNKVYIHCRSGKRAQAASATLEKMGLTNLVCISDGGMMDWIAAGYEIER